MVTPTPQWNKRVTGFQNVTPPHGAWVALSELALHTHELVLSVQHQKSRSDSPSLRRSCVFQLDAKKVQGRLAAVAQAAASNKKERTVDKALLKVRSSTEVNRKLGAPLMRSLSVYWQSATTLRRKLQLP